MHKIYVREAVPSICFKRKNDIICYPASKKDFFKNWYKNKWFYGATIKAVEKNRLKYLKNCASDFSWFTTAYNAQSSDMEINAFADFFEIHFLHFLIADRIVVEMGGKHEERFSNLAPHLKDVDLLWNRTKRICEYYKIDWIQFAESLILIKV